MLSAILIALFWVAYAFELHIIPKIDGSFASPSNIAWPLSATIFIAALEVLIIKDGRKQNR